MAMNCWTHIDKLKKEAQSLERTLDAMSWKLLSSEGGVYRARSNRTLDHEKPLVTGRTPAEVLSKVEAFTKRFPLKSKGGAR
jgi:hypothetical protein